jgi:murein DD-endopeptidase MepM/ murein hydrolase activator NlpD
VAAALVLLGALLWAVPARADTESDLNDAKDRVSQVKAELGEITAQWQATETKLAVAQDALRDAQLRIAELQARLGRVQRRLNERVRAVYMAGGNATLGALLGSETFADFADRLQFATNIVQGDEDLATEVAVRSEQLRRERERLTREAEAYAAAAAELETQRQAISTKLEEVQDLYDELYAKFKEEQEQQAIGLPVQGVGASFPVSSSGAIQTCPVYGPVSFVDSFGWPRPGGRTHQGIDMIAPYGTPIVAVHDGTAVVAPNALGGNAVILYHDGVADWTYYAHLSSYGSSGHVGAGTAVGYVGATGDTSVNHLHFEYHPNGGAAVDPYQTLLAVC